MNIAKNMALALLLVFVWSQVEAGSTSVRTEVRDGKKIHTKTKTDGKGTTTTIVTITDKKTKEQISQTTTVTDAQGNLVSTDDPEVQARFDKEKKAKNARAAAIKAGPRRKANEPILTAVFKTTMSDKLDKMTKDHIFNYIKPFYRDDPVIQTIKRKTVNTYDERYDFKTGHAKAGSGFSALSTGGVSFLDADIYVVSHADVEEKVGINKRTKKLGKAPFYVLKAWIYCDFLDGVWEVEHEGHLLLNQQVSKEFVEKIKATIKTQIGPLMPTNSKRFRRASGQKPTASDEEALGNALKGLFKKK